MKTYIDGDILRDAGIHINYNANTFVDHIFNYANTKGVFNFIIPFKDYVALAEKILQSKFTSFTAPGGLNKDGLPWFSIIGITFTAIPESEVPKYKMLK